MVQAAAGAGSKEPSLEVARLRSHGGHEDVNRCEVTKKGDAKRSHFAATMCPLQDNVEIEGDN